ncbi:MAG: long-subunit fatty acid transport protein, partial [Thermoproteota archaeon]
GVHTGIQTEGETYIVARGNGDSGSSNGKLKFQASPSAAVILGYTKYWKDFIFYATFQDEVKNEFDTTASGYTPLGGSATIPFDLKLTALLYYDPRILRLGSFYKSNNSFNFITTIEYQDWSGFEAPKTHIITSSGFNSSTDYESLETKGIIVPKVAAQYIYSEKLKINAGLYYRPSPIESNLGAGGNSLDPEVYAASVGLTYKQKILGELINFSSAFQFQYLKNQDVSKSDLDEAGASGKKIGAPGYSVGGSVQVVSFGVDWQV